ncbi:MAG TPA: sulfotransferase [Bacillota bacterium]
MLPNFICPGAARSATTNLYYLLIQHPRIYLPAIKETRFFSQDYEKGLAWYERKYYAAVKDEIAIGDISPVYLIDERCPERIFRLLGKDIKFIIMLRNPVDRAYSHYCMLRSHQFEDLPFEAALQLEERERVVKSLKYYRHQYGFQYLKESSYFQLIQRYLQFFARDRFKFIVFEEFIKDTEVHLNKILDFLGIREPYRFDLNVYRNPATVSNNSRINRLFYCNPLLKKARNYIQMKTGWKTQSLLKKVKNTLLTKENSPIPPLDEKLRRQLNSYFDTEIKQLEAFLGRDLSIWKQPDRKEVE